MAGMLHFVSQLLPGVSRGPPDSLLIPHPVLTADKCLNLPPREDGVPSQRAVGRAVASRLAAYLLSANMAPSPATHV